MTPSSIVIGAVVAIAIVGPAAWKLTEASDSAIKQETIVKQMSAKIDRLAAQIDQSNCNKEK